MADKVYLISNAHLDPVWLWRWQEGFSEVMATYRSALDRLNEYPDLKFTSACVCYYEWIEQVAPKMADEIRKRIEEGRWEVTGGWYIQPDCNMPSGESFARHSLICQDYMLSHYGKRATTGYNVDSFGHSGALPKILRASGLDKYIFMRPGVDEKQLPDAFKWRSDDGSEVTTYRIPYRYCIDLRAIELIDEIKNRTQDGLPRMAFVGVGNHGGGPTIKLIEKIAEKKDDMLEYATTEAYFSQIEGKDLPTVSEELQHHAIGCYSAVSEIKKNNALCEANLYCAEAFSTLAEALTGADYPAEEYKRAWKSVLFNQFHDIICGCSIKSAYDDARKLHNEALAITEREINFALQRIALAIDTAVGEETECELVANRRLWKHEKLGSPIVVFNANPFAVSELVKTDGMAKRVENELGEAVAIQKVRAERNNCDDDIFATAFIAQVPALGYRVYRVFFDEESGEKFEQFTSASGNLLKNEKLTVVFSEKSGEIASITDNETGEELLRKSCVNVVLDETDCDTWAHDKEILGETVGSFSKPVISVIENGKIRSTIEVKQYYGKSELVRRYSLLSGQSEIIVESKINFHEKHRVVKICLPVGKKVVTGSQFGTVTRRATASEEPFVRWLASDGIGIATSSKYGYDCKRGYARITALRSPVYADHYGQKTRDEISEYTDQGISEFTYSIFPFVSKSDAQNKCEKLIKPLRVVNTSFHDGSLPQKYCGLSVSDENLVVSCIKKSQTGNDTIVRFADYEGKRGKATIKVFDKMLTTRYEKNAIVTLKGANKVNLLEE